MGTQPKEKKLRRGVQRTRLTREFYSLATQEVARGLLGKLLVRSTNDGQRLSGIVVEVEAYLSQGDSASHSRPGPGKKNASMFLAPGTLYVYPIHSRVCLNVVTEETAVGAAVLIRALEPWEGIARMAEHRGVSLETNPENSESSLQTLRQLSSGPARLCESLSVDRGLDGIDLTTNALLWLEHCPPAAEILPKICCGRRIGVSQSSELPLRWFFDGNRFVSGRAGEHSNGRNWTFKTRCEAVQSNAGREAPRIGRKSKPSGKTGRDKVCGYR